MDSHDVAVDRRIALKLAGLGAVRAGRMGAAVLAVLLAGCSPTATQSVEFGANDVRAIDPHFFTYDGSGPPAEATHITDSEAIEELVVAFTDVPGATVAQLPTRSDGAQATTVDYTLMDGSEVTLTQVFVDYHDVFIMWPDGTIQETDWGSPLEHFYRDRGAPTP